MPPELAKQFNAVVAGSDDEYLAELRELLSTAIIAIAKYVGPDRIEPPDSPAARKLRCDADATCQNAAAVAATRMLEIARRLRLPDADSWGQPLRELLLNHRLAWADRLSGITVYYERLGRLLPAETLSTASPPAGHEGAVTFGKWRVAPGEASFDGKDLPDLKRRHRRVLAELVKGNGRTVTMTTLRLCIAEAAEDKDNAVRNYVSKIRKAFRAVVPDTDAEPIQDMDGEAYRLAVS
jgi:hypothetical protein